MSVGFLKNLFAPRLNTVTLDGLPRSACALAVVLETIDHLRDEGLVAGGSIRCNERGRDFAQRLLTAGFKFNPGEMEGLVEGLQARGGRLAREGLKPSQPWPRS